MTRLIATSMLVLMLAGCGGGNDAEAPQNLQTSPAMRPIDAVTSLIQAANAKDFAAYQLATSDTQDQQEVEGKIFPRVSDSHFEHTETEPVGNTWHVKGMLTITGTDASGNAQTETRAWIFVVERVGNTLKVNRRESERISATLRG